MDRERKRKLFQKSWLGLLDSIIVVVFIEM